jgi:hypothetical protein
MRIYPAINIAYPGALSHSRLISCLCLSRSSRAGVWRCCRGLETATRPKKKVVVSANSTPGQSRAAPMPTAITSIHRACAPGHHLPFIWRRPN